MIRHRITLHETGNNIGNGIWWEHLGTLTYTDVITSSGEGLPHYISAVHADMLIIRSW